ncbi:serine/threonine-protein kinase [Kitasatospora sp. GP82]|uniref:serine/threonine-protein kinase n=1 Tax=Kitasatospora sp. GP82 TaxID=3035089 RepID=UPI002473D54E|nr:serine/threonine-protein kinase [Kitasatospora sp. GP82]MDH6130207.1 hypothetical protein [Kitasatospora sp. GP82]
MTNWLAPGYVEIRQLSDGARGRFALVRKDRSDELRVIQYLFVGPTVDGADAHRIRREAALLARGSDPGVVRIHEVLDAPDGVSIALVMEAVQGPVLRGLLSARPLRPEAALAVLHDTLLGMVAAHERGIVHRDFGPDNVLVTSVGRGKLTNIGVAAQGAPAYRAPELWSGGPASPASDLYAAGATLFECLTGTQPFRGTAAELPVLHRTAGAQLDELPEPVRPLVARAMAKDPRERYSDAGAFVADLVAVAGAAYGPDWLEHGVQALADAAEVASGSQAPAIPDRSPVKRRRTWLAAVAGVVVLAVVAVLLVLDDGGSKPVVREPFVEALAALAKAPGVRYHDQQVNFEYFDVTMTSSGERFGSVGSTPDASGKSDEAFLTVGGRDYTNFKNDPTTSGWIYTPGDDEKNFAPALKDYQTPAQLAAALTKALDQKQKPRLPVVGDASAKSTSVDGTPAWKADTVDGYVYVTQNSPYRLLRWEPPGVETLLNATPKSQLPRSVEARTPLSNSRGMDVTPIADAAQPYGTVIQDTKDLANATTGASVQILETDDAGKVNCGHSGCHVEVDFTGPVYNATSADYALTDVYIDMSVASITIAGQEVGGCTSGPQPFQLTGDTLTGKLTCDNPQAGPAADAAAAQNQQIANANGSSQYWDVTSVPQLDVRPLSSADIGQLVTKEQDEEQSAGHVPGE